MKELKRREFLRYSTVAIDHSLPVGPFNANSTAESVKARQACASVVGKTTLVVLELSDFQSVVDCAAVSQIGVPLVQSAQQGRIVHVGSCQGYLAAPPLVSTLTTCAVKEASWAPTIFTTRLWLTSCGICRWKYAKAMSGKTVWRLT